MRSGTNHRSDVLAELAAHQDPATQVSADRRGLSRPGQVSRLNVTSPSMLRKESIARYVALM
jgi:hypothetical protein